MAADYLANCCIFGARRAPLLCPCISEDALAFICHLEKDFRLLSSGWPDVLGGDETFSLQSAEGKERGRIA